MAHAQPETPAPASPQLEMPQGTVNCFDYYHFQSVQSFVTADNTLKKAGEIINFLGEFRNQNDYPVVNGTLYVKIMKDVTVADAPNGPEVYDEFVAQNNITVPAKGTSPISFSWKIPSSLTTGMYAVVSYFIVDNKYNLLGLSFTDNVIGNISEFRVEGQETNVQFSKVVDGTSIDGAPLSLISFPPQIKGKKPAIISTTVKNTTDKDETVKIDWNLYKWDAIAPENLIRKSSVDVTVKAKSTTKVEFTVTEESDPIYYIVATLNYKDAKSVLNIRFARPENNKIMLSYPSVTKFPITKNETNTMFSCLNNNGTASVVKDGKLYLKVTDVNDKTIADYTYTGDVTGAMMAVKNDFVSKKSYDHFFLIASLYHAGLLVDESKIEYDCAKINPGLCFPKSNYMPYIIAGIIIFLIIVLMLIILIVKKKNSGNQPA